MSDDLLIRAIAWRNGPDTGLSSIALMCFLMDWPNDGSSPHHRYATPSDCWDFGRCYQMLQKVPELKERLSNARRMSLEWKNLVDCWPKLEELYRKAGFGWSDDLYEALNTCNGWRCVDCGARLHSKTAGEPSRCVGGCKPPEPVAPPPSVEQIRQNLVVGYLLIDENGDVVSGEGNCPECEGTGFVDCTCGNCDDTHDKKCSDCRGSGKQKVTWSLDVEPEAQEGESVVVAIVDKRNLKGPRIAYPSIEGANHALQALLELSDETLSSFFTERRAA